MPQILVEPLSSDLTAEEVEELLECLHSLDPSYDAKVASGGVYWEGGGGGLEWVELIIVWIPWDNIGQGIAAGAAKAVVDRVVEWARNRPEKKVTTGRGLPPAGRPYDTQDPRKEGEEKTVETQIWIYGPRGERLQEVRVKGPGTEPEYGPLEVSGSFKARRPQVEGRPPRNSRP
jgi:hypothetical protein